jgi:hypothetical protein
MNLSTELNSSLSPSYDTTATWQAYVLQLRRLEERAIFYGTIFMVFPGLLMNILNIVVFNRRAFAANMRFYYTFLSALDAFNLLVCVVSFVPFSYERGLNFQSDASCKLLSFLRRLGTHSSSWTLVIISFDRVFYIMFNATYRSILGAKYFLSSVTLMLSIVTATSCISFVFMLTETRLNVNNQTLLLLDCVAPRSMGLWVNVSAFLMRAIVPFVLMFTLNLVLIRKLFWIKSQVRKVNSSKKELHFAFTIIAINYVFLLLNLPLIAQQIYEYWPNTDSDDHRARMRLLQVLSGILLYAFHAYTLFFHLKFNIIFRKELLKIIRISRSR